MMHPGALLAVGAGALALLARRGRTHDGGNGNGNATQAEVERIVRESREIVQGKRDSYSDKPGEKVTPIEAAERTKDALDKAKTNTDKVTQVAEADEALKAAREAAVREAGLEPEPAKPKPKPKPKPEPAKPKSKARAKLSVRVAQNLLNTLGFHLQPDGKYGPLTQSAWQQSATQRGLDPAFVRLDGMNAQVDKATLAALTAAASSPTPTPKPPTPKPEPARPAPGPQPPPGFDRVKASNAAPDVARHLNQKGRDHYSRPALRAWQTTAGIEPDGIYGRGSAAALRYYVGAKAPKPFFAQGEDVYPWGK